MWDSEAKDRNESVLLGSQGECGRGWENDNIISVSKDLAVELSVSWSPDLIWPDLGMLFLSPYLVYKLSQSKLSWEVSLDCSPLAVKSGVYRWAWDVTRIYS